MCVPECTHKIPWLKLQFYCVFTCLNDNLTVFKHTVYSLEPVPPTEFREKKMDYSKIFGQWQRFISLKLTSAFQLLAHTWIANFPAHRWAKYFACWIYIMLNATFFFFFTDPPKSKTQLYPFNCCFEGLNPSRSCADTRKEIKTVNVSTAMQLYTNMHF